MSYIYPLAMVDKAAEAVLGKKISDGAALGLHHQIIFDLTCALCGQHLSGGLFESTTLVELKNIVLRWVRRGPVEGDAELAVIQQQQEVRRQEELVALAKIAVRLTERVPEGLPVRFQQEALHSVFGLLQDLLKYGRYEKSFRKPYDYGWSSKKSAIQDLTRLQTAWKGLVTVTAKSTLDGVELWFQVPGWSD